MFDSIILYQVEGVQITFCSWYSLVGFAFLCVKLLSQ